MRSRFRFAQRARRCAVNSLLYFVAGYLCALAAITVALSLCKASGKEPPTPSMPVVRGASKVLDKYEYNDDE